MRRLLASDLSQEQPNTPKEIWDLFDAQLHASLKINCVFIDWRFRVCINT